MKFSSNLVEMISMMYLYDGIIEIIPTKFHQEIQTASRCNKNLIYNLFFDH
ncbi:hypothetical protein LguiB_018348 [Lonicera macranthoides]